MNCSDSQTLAVVLGATFLMLFKLVEVCTLRSILRHVQLLVFKHSFIYETTESILIGNNRVCVWSVSVCVCVHTREGFNCVLVLCFVMGYMLQFGETAHKRAQYYYYC